MATKSKDESLVVTALGGLHELGKNMYVFELCDSKRLTEETKKELLNPKEIVIVDAGVLYPGPEAPGVDYTMAEYNYLIKKSDAIKALVITSPHEAHGGGAHHLINKCGIKKVIGSKISLSLIRQRLGEKEAKKIEWVEFEPRVDIEVGSFALRPITLTSSSSESYALLVKAADSKVLYTGTYKIEQTPTDSIKTDVYDLTQIGTVAAENDDPVDLYISDSANAEQEGYSTSEKELINKFRSIMESSAGRVIINTYNANTIRIQNLFKLAAQCDRKVALLNKDAREFCRASKEVGCLEYQEDILISIKEIDNYPDNEILVISTAPEGEALRELESMGFDRSLEIQIKEGDVVVNSGDLPPGTVRVMAQISDEFHLKKAQIIGGRNAGVHAHSHALTEEIKFMYNLIKPKNIMPAMGETRQLIRHAKLAVEAGFDPGSIFILDNGDQVKLSGGDLEVLGHVDTDGILFNDSQDFHVDNKLIKEREGLATEGIVTVSFSINKKIEVVSGPVFSAKACTFSNNKEWRAFCLMNSPDLIDAIDQHKQDNPEASLDNIQTVVREHMNHIIKTQIGKKPAVIVLANQV